MPTETAQQIISFTWATAAAVVASTTVIVAGLSRIFVKNGWQKDIAKLWTATKQQETLIGAINGDLSEIREGQKEHDRKLSSTTKDIYGKIDTVVKDLGDRIDSRFDSLNETIIEQLRR